MASQEGSEPPTYGLEVVRRPIALLKSKLQTIEYIGFFRFQNWHKITNTEFRGKVLLKILPFLPQLNSLVMARLSAFLK